MDYVLTMFSLKNACTHFLNFVLANVYIIILHSKHVPTERRDYFPFNFAGEKKRIIAPPTPTIRIFQDALGGFLVCHA